MHRLSLGFIAVVLLAGCADSSGLAPLPTPHVTAGFPPGTVVNTISIDVLDSEPLRAAELVAPDGTTTEANWLNLRGQPETSGGQRANTTPWRNSATFGDAALGALPTAALTGSAYASSSQLLLLAADATIALPDPVAYRRDWQHYRLRLTFGAPGGPDIRELPAPQPPATG